MTYKYCPVFALYLHCIETTVSLQCKYSAKTGQYLYAIFPLHASADDPILQELREIIQQGWPECKKDVPPSVRAYYDFRDELTVQDQLVFKGPRIVIPAALRREMMSTIHASHIGIEGSIRRARDSLYWPRMSSDLKEYISKCDVCLSHRAVPGKESLLQHEIPE